MRKHLKKYFIPHKKNNYHPHIFRNVSIVTVIGICIFLLGVSYGNYVFLRETVMGANIATNVLIDLANTNRSENQIQPLKKSEKLAIAAELKANDMIDNQYFAHFAPDGTTPWYFIKKAGYDFSYAGENLAINFTDPEQVDNAWMSSPLHRGNLLNANFKDVGVAAVPGKYNDSESIYVVQMFGSLASVEKKEVTAEVNIVSSEPIKVIQEDKNFISVKNISDSTSTTELAPALGVLGVEVYASFFDRLIFNSSFFIQLFLILILITVFIGLCIRIFIEYERQHRRHLAISVIFLLLILFLAAVNLRFINFF